MENLQWRAIVALVISLIIILAWDFFVGVPGPKTPPPPAAQQSQVAQQAAPVAATPTLAPAPPGTTAAHPARDVVVVTPLYRAVFSEQGARLKSFELYKFRESVDKNSPPKELVRINNPAQWPLGLALLKPAVNTDGAVYTANIQSLDLTGSGPQQAAVSFELTTREGVRVVKRFDFRRDLYRIDLNVAVQNVGTQPIEAEPSLSLTSLPFGHDDRAYHQTAVSVGGKVETVSSSKLEEPRVIRGNVQWAAYDEPFFVAALVPRDQTVHVRLASSGPLVTESVISQPEQIAPGASHTYAYGIYYGPKEMKVLAAQKLGLESVIEYGWFDIIAKPLMVLLNWMYDVTHNYGVAIILLTVLIKLIFWPLSHKSYRSMKEMQKLQPKLAQLKEKYKGDTAKLNQEMLDLYRTYKVNPMGGCLPMVAQIPVFFALYRVLQYSIELRHAPFVGWINDLSAPDRLAVGFQVPYVGGLPVLTLLMGVSMWLQQKMTPVTGDPAQAKMMQVLPIVFTFMFIYFPSGLVLYWLVNNVLSIGQQYYINHHTA